MNAQMCTMDQSINFFQIKWNLLDIPVCFFLDNYFINHETLDTSLHFIITFQLKYDQLLNLNP